MREAQIPNDFDDDAPTQLRRVQRPPAPELDLGLFDDDAPTQLLKAPARAAATSITAAVTAATAATAHAADFEDDAPTQLLPVPRLEQTPGPGPIAAKPERMRVHPKFDPRCLPTMRMLRPAVPPPLPRRNGAPPEGTMTLPRRRPTGLMPSTHRGVDLGWVAAFVIAAFLVVALAALFAVFRPGD